MLGCLVCSPAQSRTHCEPACLPAPRTCAAAANPWMTQTKLVVKPDCLFGKRSVAPRCLLLLDSQLFLSVLQQALPIRPPVPLPVSQSMLLSANTPCRAPAHPQRQARPGGSTACHFASQQTITCMPPYAAPWPAAASTTWWASSWTTPRPSSSLPRA
jgi:hypothetical protein